MSIIGSNILAGSSGQGGAYEIEQSLRFDGSAYLSLAATSSGGSSNFTLSTWVKLTKNTGTNGCIFGGSGYAANAQGVFLGDGNSKLSVAYNWGIDGTGQISNALFRDPSAWYHLVMKVAGTNLDLYINNEEVSLSQDQSYSTNNFNSSSVARLIGAVATNSPSDKFNGYLAEFHFVDGSALDPDSFGEPDDNGVWRPIEYTGSHGSNGFYLTFDPSATNGIGHDHSGNGNNWTATGFTTSGTGTDVMSDTPTTNYATVNPLQTAIYSTAVPTITNGNLVTENGGSGWSAATGTIAVSSGKWYWEYTCSGVTASEKIRNGVYKQSGVLSATGGDIPSSSDVHTYASDGTRWNGSSFVSYGATYTSGDTIGVALDLDAGTLVFYKNNTSQGTAYTGLSGTYSPYFAQSTDPVSTVNFGQRDFAYTPPTGFKALNTSNLPAPEIADGSDYFNTVLYTGNATARSITGVGFQPDWVWIKRRSASEWHLLSDSVRGVNAQLATNTTYQEQSRTDQITSFDTDGFSLGTDGAGYSNANTSTYVAWNWLAGGSGSSNTDGSITSTVSANPTAGFSIVSYSGTSTDNATIGHGLGVAPAMVIVKCRSSNANGSAGAHWLTRHQSIGMTGSGTSCQLFLNLTNGLLNNDHGTLITSGSNLLQVKASGSGIPYFHVSETGQDYIAYCFAEVEGYSKFGSYTGNGTTTGDGPFVFCGFKPSLIVLKASSASDNWRMYDDKRLGYNSSNSLLYPNLTNAEAATTDHVDILSNGFKLRSDNNNSSGVTYVFMAFASSPFGGSGVSPATAR